MKTPDLEKVAQIITDVAETEVMPRFKNLTVSDVGTKNSAEDLVTTADVETERQLTQRLRELMPEAAVVGEEAAFINPDVLDALKQDDPVWVIDPIDGTMNFSYGSSEFGMVVALVHKGETVAGWLYNPTRRVMLMGEKGSGVMLRGKKQVFVAKPKADLTQMNGVVGRRVAFKDPKLRKPMWWGSASYGYVMVVTGEVDYTAYRTKVIKPWDHAAGVMLHMEAGGYTAYVDGNPYTPLMGSSHLISAPNKDAWEYLKRNICAPAN